MNCASASIFKRKLRLELRKHMMRRFGTIQLMLLTLIAVALMTIHRSTFNRDKSCKIRRVRNASPASSMGFSQKLR